MVVLQVDSISYAASFHLQQASVGRKFAKLVVVGDDVVLHEGGSHRRQTRDLTRWTSFTRGECNKKVSAGLGPQKLDPSYDAANQYNLKWDDSIYSLRNW